ncbi:MAG: transposase [Ruminiclostridium sp.]|nr:transposase [Ruminiclostridium sp.]
MAANNIKHSYSRTQTPHDNAVSESFFSSMKREELYRRKISSEQQLFKVIEDYIGFYNQKRPHATLNYKTPVEFDNEYYNKQV